jgi:hypothetical protein
MSLKIKVRVVAPNHVIRAFITLFDVHSKSAITFHRALRGPFDKDCECDPASNVDRNPTVSQFSGSMGDATAFARRRIDGWMRRRRRKAGSST